MMDQLKNEYLKWAEQKISFEDNSDFIEIATPFVDMHHDYISLFFIKGNNNYKLSDDGYIVDELGSLGIDVKGSQKRKDFFKTTLHLFGVDFNKMTSELYVEFENFNEYPEIQHRLIQCAIRISDMMLTSRNRVISFFTEDIANFFLENEVLYSEYPSFIGRTGLTRTFEFVLPKSKKVKPKLIKAVNNPTSEAYRDPLLSFIDVQETKYDHNFLVLANDLNADISERFTESLNNFNISVLPWSERKNWVTDLIV